MSELITDPNCFDSANPVHGVLSRSYYLFPAAGQVAAGSGPWCDTRVVKNSNAQIYGTFGGGSVQLFGSNDPNPVVSGDTGIAIGAAVTVAGMVTISSPYRFIRAVLTGGASPAVKAVLHAVA